VCLLNQWSSTFIVESPPTGTLFENRPLPIIFALSENINCFKNNFNFNEIQTGNLLCKCICKINVIQFPKKQLVPSNANLVMLFVCKLFQSSLQVGQLKYGISTGLVHVKTIAVFLVVCSTRQHPCSAKYVVGNASNYSFNSPQSSGKRSLHATSINLTTRLHEI